MKFLMILLCKLLAFAGKLVKKGSSLPGKIVLKLCPNILQKITLPKYVIAVTGSNGKTSTVEMIANVMTENGLNVVWNKEGSNQTEGVTTLLLKNCDFHGKVMGDVVVLESDERYARHTFKNIKPTHFAVTNLYRDQLTRNVHPFWIYDIIKEAADLIPDAELILNSDDPIVSMLGKDRDKVRYFAMAKNEYCSDKTDALYNDCHYCPICGSPLSYEYFHFAHLGKFYCAYTTNICNTINLRYQNGNSLSGLESKTLYWNGGTWCKQSGCTDCGYSDKDVLTNSAGYYPAYFSQTSTNKLYQVIGSGANIEKIITEATGLRFPCSYENETLTCNYIKDSSYTWYVYVFVAPRVTGAITGGNLQNFETAINGTSIHISGKYYPMMCSDHIKVHFYGINSLGNYGELTARNNYVKYFYETGDWVNANGTTSDTFAGLGILSNLTNSTTVNGTTYGNGLSAYRAAYIGGAPTSTTPPDNIIITKTTGIVTPEDRPYDLMVTGDSLPKLPQSLFSNDNGSVKDMYYNLLYAANCLDPDGLESHSTCELEIHPNGRVLYKNQCLLGWKDGNFGDDSLTNATVPSQMLNVTDTCEM